MGRAARVVIGSQQREAEVRLAVFTREQTALVQAQAALAAAAPVAVGGGGVPAPVGAGPLVERRIKLGAVVDQLHDQEVAVATEEAFSVALGVYQGIMGGSPLPEHEITIEQFTGLKAALAMGPPYVDFSIWGPFGHRKDLKQDALIQRLQSCIQEPS